MIDSEGFRHNVGIIISNSRRELFWGRRIGQNAWQFPQGGMNDNETPEEAMFRELQEEVGLSPDQVEIIGCTADWLHYKLPQKYIRKHCQPLCIGQKQIWFLLKLNCADSAFNLAHTDQPEFEEWRWIKYWQPIREVIYFKRRVYSRALRELAPLLGTNSTPSGPRANYLRQNRR
ncbi:MAG: RNA pyrophosphohydrolase [Candidatus Polarisedimenticolaceae bacterium]|nr:RNA pyrophosphohydrolase [Candidatus Polarisedimenticolaceae bacterium]